MRTHFQVCPANAICIATVAILAGCARMQSTAIDQQLVGDVMLHSELAPNLRALCMPGGRLSGTPNAEKAENFVADKLRAYGLKNVHFESFELQTWIVHETQVTAVGDPPRELAGAIALGKTMSTPADGVTAELVDVGEGKEADFKAHAALLRGKFAFVHPDSGHRRDRVVPAMSAGAAGVVFMAEKDHLPTIGNGHEQPRPEPAVVIPYNQDLLDELKAGKTPRLSIRLRTDNWVARPNNVVGEIPGVGPTAREVVLVGAHLDSWHLAEGAIDNGIGSAAILETARALARSGWRPRRTVRFVWFAGEELDLRGSRAYVAAHESELDTIVCDVNVDMPGAPRKFVRFLHPELEPLLKAVIAELPGYELDPEPAVVSEAGGGSDQAPFVERGVAAVALWGEIGPGVKNYHTAGDTYDIVDRRGTTAAAAVLAVLVRHLADAPQRPAMRQLPTTAPAE